MVPLESWREITHYPDTQGSVTSGSPQLPSPSFPRYPFIHQPKREENSWVCHVLTAQARIRTQTHGFVVRHANHFTIKETHTYTGASTLKGQCFFFLMGYSRKKCKCLIFFNVLHKLKLSFSLMTTLKSNTTGVARRHCRRLTPQSRVTLDSHHCCCYFQCPHHRLSTWLSDLVPPHQRHEKLIYLAE